MQTGAQVNSALFMTRCHLLGFGVSAPACDDLLRLAVECLVQSAAVRQIDAVETLLRRQIVSVVRHVFVHVVCEIYGQVL